MTLPPGVETDDRAELLLALPADWLDGGPGKTVPPERYWPIGVMKFLARLPHSYRTWLGIGHTIPSADPPEPWYPGVPFTGVVMVPPVELLPDDWRVETGDGRHVRLLTPVFLTTAELDFKLQNGLDALLDLLEAHEVFELLDLARAPMV